MELKCLQALMTPSGVVMTPHNGGHLVRNVTLLMAGTWTDGGTGTALHYSEKTLEAYATNWEKNGLWVVHTGGMPRKMTDKVGEILNPRYEDGAIKGDLFFYNNTTASQDAFKLVDAGVRGEITPVSFSCEHVGEEVYNPDLKMYEAASLKFYGGALVEEGASGGTKIYSRFEPMEIKELEIKEEVNDMDKAEIEALIAEKIASYEAKFTELSAKIDAFKVPEPVKVEEVAEVKPEPVPDPKIAELGAEVERLKELVAKLESQPVTVVKEMAAPEEPGEVIRFVAKTTDGRITRR